MNLNVEKLRKWLFKATIDQRAKYSAFVFTALMFIFVLITFIVSLISSPPKHIAVAIIIMLVASLVGSAFSYFAFYYLVRRAIKAVNQKRNEALGFEPSPDENEELYQFYKNGVTPSSKRVRAGLPEFLNYLESRLDGTYSDSYTSSKGYFYYNLAIAAMELVLAITDIIGKDKNYVAATLLFIGSILVTVGAFLTKRKAKRPFNLAKKLNYKRLAKIDARRHGLGLVDHA